MFFTFTWLNLKVKYKLVTAGKTLTTILKIFFYTVGWSIKLAKNWATEN